MTAPFIPDSYTRASEALDLIRAMVSQRITTGESAMTTLSQVADELGDLASAFPVGFLETIQFIDAEVAANQDDAAWARLKDEKDKIVADFIAAKGRFDAIVAALSGR